MNTAPAIRLYPANPPIAILGVPFDNVTPAETTALVEQMIASRRPHYLVAANVHFLVQAQADLDLQRILLGAHLVLCDGTPLVWASRLLGNPLPQRVAGSDLVPLLLRLAAGRNYRVFLLGDTQERIDQALARLRTDYPQLTVSGHAPAPGQSLETDLDEIKRRIQEDRPDFLLTAIDGPAQEKWIAQHYQSLGVPVSVGMGGAIDIPSGQVHRPPAVPLPRRLKDLFVFSVTILAQWWQLQFRRNRPGAARDVSAPVKAETEWQWIKLPERLDMHAVRDDALLVDQVLADGRDCLLEMTNVKFIDSTGVGMLIRLQKKIRVTGRQLVLLSPSRAVTRALSLMHLDDYFATAADFPGARQLLESRLLEKQSASGEGQSLAWRGEITAGHDGETWQMTEKAVNLLPAGSRLSIDLSAVPFVDSAGLGVMLRVRKLAQHRGVSLEFTQAQPAVREVLRLARLEAFLLGKPA